MLAQFHLTRTHFDTICVVYSLNNIFSSQFLQVFKKQNLIDAKIGVTHNAEQ